MIKFSKFLTELHEIMCPDQMKLWEMTGVRPKLSGIPVHMWISPKAG